MRRIRIFAGIVLLLTACGGRAPESPRVYIIGVDASRSFWHSAMVTQKKAASISREQALEVVSDLRDCVNKINIVSDEKTFVVRTKRVSGDFVKQFDREGMRRALDNVTDVIVALANGVSRPRAMLSMADEVHANLNLLAVSLTKFDYERTTVPEKFDDSLNPQSVQQIKRCIVRAKMGLDKFSVEVTVPDQPEKVRQLQADVTQLVTMFVAGIEEANKEPLNPDIVKMGLYGSIPHLNSNLFFLVGTSSSTATLPSAAELNETINRLVNQSLSAGWRVFHAGTDYGTFFRRSFMEVQNLVSAWGAFDRDIGIELRYIIIGDGKNDPAGSYELSGVQDKTLIDEVKNSFASAGTKDSVIAGIPWENIKDVSVIFCVPKKEYNTEILDYWTKMLQDIVPGKKIHVRYFMFDALKDSGGGFNQDKIKGILE
ncbi:MAG: hypothetical protein NTU66_02880 [Elusimicrobia bacterium]|nr:hypothetical protein [Elusimicrobiota bacterium]